MKYDKPFKTYDELLDLMESRNITISDRTFATHVLSDVSYYTLINGYKDTFLSLSNSDLFIPGTKFDELYSIQILNENISAIFLKYILYIERSLKSKISYTVSKNYGVYTNLNEHGDGYPDDYLYLKHYSSSNNKRKNILHKIRSAGLEPRNNLSLRHYSQNKNHIPPWILITNVPFGLSIQWYGILKALDKDYVCQEMLRYTNIDLASKKELLAKSLEILKDYRNSMAHGSKTFAKVTRSELPKKPLFLSCSSLLSSDEYNAGIGKNDLYSVLIIICLLINDPYIHTNLFSDLFFILKE